MKKQKNKTKENKWEILFDSFNKNKKIVIVHSSIIILFVISLCFAYKPLFELTYSYEWAAKRQNIKLSGVTNNIQYYIDRFAVEENLIEINGWAFIKGEDAVNSVIFLVFKSDIETYVFNTMIQEREGVAKTFPDLGTNLEKTGFVVLLYPESILSGDYLVGVYIQNNEGDALQFVEKNKINVIVNCEDLNINFVNIVK